MLDVHQQTLRIYEKEGLIKPTRTRGNTRLYSEKDIENIRLILRLTNDLGVNIAGVGVILEMRQKMEEMARQYEDRMQTIMQEMVNNFMSYLEHASCLPVLSDKKGLIIRSEGNNKKL
ncbi:MerR family transcriptional regulator [bacterium]|nr:MerR family transcriptional regulator [bacterium]